MSLPAQTSSLRRIIVAVALFGVLIVAHLGLQQRANGLTAGCTGLADLSSAEVVESGCLDVTTGPYADFLGVSNIAWGLAFYVLFVLLRLVYAMTGDDRLRLGSLLMATIGVLYSAYLVYLQAAVIKSFCLICMTSAATALTLFALHVIEHKRIRTAVSTPPRRAQADQKGLAALRSYIPIFGLFVVLLGGVALLAANSKDAAAGGAGGLGLLANGDTSQVNIIPVVEGTCDYDPNIEPFTNLEAFTSGPFKGSPDASVSVVEIFDPNCPHCKDLGEAMEPVIDEYGDRAKFFLVPYPLRPQSVGQVIALKLATREGKFHDLVAEMFKRQDNQWGMSLPELITTVEAVGMNGETMQALFDDEAAIQPYLDQLTAERDVATAAFALPDGSISVPKLAVNGRVVAPTLSSMNPACIGELIAKAAAGE